MSMEEIYSILLRALSTGRQALDNVILDHKDEARSNLQTLNIDLHEVLSRIKAPDQELTDSHKQQDPHCAGIPLSTNN